MAGYNDDLAYIHHAGFADFAVNSAPWILATLRRRGIASGLVVDLGCGSGLWARRLTDAGYEVLGIDQSAGFLALARTEAPRATFRKGSFLKVKLPRCDAVTALSEVLGYLFDADNTQRELFRFFGRVHAALRPGGVFIFDLAGPGRVPGEAPARVYRTGEDWAVLVERQADRRQSVLTRRITTFRKVGELYRRGEEVHRLRLYERENIAEALQQQGFRVRVVRGYGQMRFPKGLFGFIAQKPGAPAVRATRRTPPA